MNTDSSLLLELTTFQMPFGRYKGCVIASLPVSYLEWFERQGFPAGRLGMLLATMHVIKTNGLEDLLRPLN
jgi:uncharacterized protein (DUF3820 family)